MSVIEDIVVAGDDYAKW